MQILREDPGADIEAARAAVRYCPTQALSIVDDETTRAVLGPDLNSPDNRGISMAGYSRGELDEMVEKWIAENDRCEKLGDWRPLADLYTEDATYGWNYGPEQEFMAVGREDPRDRARSGDGRPRRLDLPVPAVRRRRAQRRLHRPSGSRSPMPRATTARTTGPGHRRQLVPLRRQLPVVLAARLLRLRQCSDLFLEMITDNALSDGMQKRIERSMSARICRAGTRSARRRPRSGEPGHDHETRDQGGVRGLVPRTARRAPTRVAADRPADRPLRYATPHHRVRPRGHDRGRHRGVAGVESDLHPRMQRELNFGNRRRDHLQGLPARYRRAAQFMDFRYKVDDANHGEFWLDHCGR